MELKRFTDQTIVGRDALIEEAARTRVRGYAVDDREHEHTIRCIAAPVFDLHDEVAAAISVSVPTSRMTHRQLVAFVQPLLTAARAATLELGGRVDRVGPKPTKTS